MTTESDTLVTQDMIERKGKFSEPKVAPPIALSDIRKWAIAVYWPERPPRVYWDDEHARTTRWGSIIAPPDFNPFSWPIDEEGFNLKIENWKRQTKGGASSEEDSSGSEPGTRVLNGGSRVEYFIPMQPGDVITSVTKVIDIQERQSRSVGLMIMTFTENRWTNQRGELVRVFVSTSINY